MNSDNKGMIFTILAVIGGFVVLGWALKLFVHLFGAIIWIALAVIVVFVVMKLMGKR